MAKLKVLSGQEIVQILKGFGFEVASQKGSHLKLRHILSDGTRQILTIPLHKEIDRGTCHSIYRQGLRYISETDLRPHFYR